MNKERRKRLVLLESKYDSINETTDKETLLKLKKDFEDLQNIEQDIYDNIPENLQYSSRAEESEEAIDEMQDYIDELDEMLN